MPRQCSFCDNNVIRNPEVALFGITEFMRRALKPSYLKTDFICAEHFQSKDIIAHGYSKRLRRGAVPVHFPRLNAVVHDHAYFPIAKLDLVCYVTFSLFINYLIERMSMSKKYQLNVTIQH